MKIKTSSRFSDVAQDLEREMNSYMTSLKGLYPKAEDQEIVINLCEEHLLKNMTLYLKKDHPNLKLPEKIDLRKKMAYRNAHHIFVIILSTSLLITFDITATKEDLIFFLIPVIFLFRFIREKRLSSFQKVQLLIEYYLTVFFRDHENYNSIISKYITIDNRKKFIYFLVMLAAVLMFLPD